MNIRNYVYIGLVGLLGNVGCTGSSGPTAIDASQQADFKIIVSKSYIEQRPSGDGAGTTKKDSLAYHFSGTINRVDGQNFTVYALKEYFDFKGIRGIQTDSAVVGNRDVNGVILSDPNFKPYETKSYDISGKFSSKALGTDNPNITKRLTADKITNIVP